MMRRIASIGCAWLLTVSVCAAQPAKKIDVRKLTADQLRTLESKAKNGEERSMTILGMAYAEGKGSIAAAVKWLTRASRHDDVAQSYLAGMYRDGKGVAKDTAQARSLYARAASQGNLAAQFNYASLCFNGEGGTQDLDTAAKYFEIAARQGDSAAQEMIARMYEYGRGVVQDPEQAKRWYEAAANQGYGPALLSLGVAYVGGTLGVRDTVRGMEYLQRAANTGDWSAALRIANLYLNGEGVPRNEAEAYKWFAIARELGGEGSTTSMLEQKLSPSEVAGERREVTMWKTQHFQSK